jgi:hypothetical protein
MEVGGRDKILPSPSLRKVLNPLQERVMKNSKVDSKDLQTGYLRHPHTPKSKKRSTKV